MNATITLTIEELRHVKDMVNSHAQIFEAMRNNISLRNQMLAQLGKLPEEFHTFLAEIKSLAKKMNEAELK